MMDGQWTLSVTVGQNTTSCVQPVLPQTGHLSGPRQTVTTARSRVTDRTQGGRNQVKDPDN